MRRDADGGVGTVWTAAAIAVVLGVLVFALQLGAAVLARHRAEAAADLAALAAAGRAERGQRIACARAEEIATEMNGSLTECEITGWEAEVTVRVRLPFAPFDTGPASGRARAGPVALTIPVRTFAPSGRTKWTGGHTFSNKCQDAG